MYKNSRPVELIPYHGKALRHFDRWAEERGWWLLRRMACQARDLLHDQLCGGLGGLGCHPGRWRHPRRGLLAYRLGKEGCHATRHGSG